MADEPLKDSRPPVDDDRSTKKAKFREGKEGEIPPIAMSFRDKVMQTEKAREEFLAGDLDDFVVDEDDVTVCRNDGMPAIDFSEKVRSELAKQWQSTVIVKLLGRPIGYRNLCNRLDSMWNFVASFDVIDLENDYFLVKFCNINDMKSVITGGPWVMLGHYLSVQAWKPSFDVSHDQIRFINAWIRLPRMPIHYYNKKVLRHIGEIVGKVVKIDYCTETAERGKFARIAVELDLKKPLVSQFRLDGNVQYVEYECLPRICFECGRFGHVKEFCPHKKKEDIVPVHVEMEVAVTPPPARVAEKVSDDKDGNPSFGPWMMVGRKGRYVNSKNKAKKDIPPNSVKESNIVATRFDVLNTEDEEKDLGEDLLPRQLENDGGNPGNKAVNVVEKELKSKRISHAVNVNITPQRVSGPVKQRKALTDVANIQAHLENRKFTVTKAQSSLDGAKHSVVNVTYNKFQQVDKNTVSKVNDQVDSCMMVDDIVARDPDPPDDLMVDDGNKENLSSFTAHGVTDIATPVDAMFVDDLNDVGEETHLVVVGSDMDITEA